MTHSTENKICRSCETVAHCSTAGCIPLQQPAERTTVNKPESSVDEWLDEAKDLCQQWANAAYAVFAQPEYHKAKQAALAHLAAHPSNQVPEGYALVPCIGTVVKAKHPITCLNPTEFFEVTQVRAESDGKFAVRGEQTCWFGLSYLASPQAVPSEQPIAEQPKAEQPESVYFGSAGPSEGAKTALPVRVLDRGFDYVKGVHTPTVLVGFPPNDWDSRDAFAAALAHREASAGAVPSDKKYLPSMPPPAASLPVSAPAGVRMLTGGERLEAYEECGDYESDVEALQRKFCEVNGLKLAAATTKEN